MKKIFYILASAIVALGAVACENDGLDNIGLEVNGDTVSFIASIDNNRTALGEDGKSTIWENDDIIIVTWDRNGDDVITVNDYNPESTETEAFKFVTTDGKTFSCSAVGLSAIKGKDQTVTATYSHNGDGNIDSTAGTAGALLTYTGSFAEIKFAVQNAFLKFSATAGATVELTASAEIFRTQQLGLVKTVPLPANGETQYVAIKPATTTITYAINGTDYGVSKENTLVAGKIYPLGDLEVPGWNLVTDASKLAVGDQIVIAAATSNKALGTTQNNNNRAGVDATKNTTNNTIAVGADVQKIILEAGTKTGTFAFKVGTEYLYAASSSSNHLKSGVKNDNASWSISISNNVATVVAQGENTRNTIYFNENNGNPIFSAYGSKPTNGGDDIVIYKYAGKGTPIATKLEMSDDITCTAQTESTLTFTWGAVANATGYEVTINGNTETVTATTYTATGLTEKTEYIISVKAIGDGTFYTTSDAKTGKGTTDEKQQQPEGGESHEETATLTMKTIFNDTATNLNNGSTYTWGDFKVTFTKNNSNTSNYNAGDDGIRWYKEDILKFAHKDGYNITKIVINASSGYAYEPTADSGTIAVSGTTLTWSGKSTSVAITAASGQIRFKSIDITYEVTGGSTEPETPVVPEFTWNVTSTSISLGNGASGEKTFTVTNNATDAGYDIDVASSADWLTVSYANNTVTYSATANEATTERTATITLTATKDSDEKTITITVTQAAHTTATKKTYTWTLASGDIMTSAGSLTKGTPQISWAQTTATYVGWDGSKGVQVGSKNNPTTSFTLSTSNIGGTINKITVNASIASSGDAKMSINVGGINYISNKALTTSNAAYTATVDKSGEIKISFSCKSRAFYIKSIVIEYTE